MTKQQARALARRRRRDMAAQMPALGAAMVRALTALPVWQAAPAVLCFAALPDEPDTGPALRAALEGGKRLFLPRVTDGLMETVPVQGLGALVPGAYGILEPSGPAEALPPGTLALVPCLAMDKKGVRLGRGGGYYDRFLAAHSGPRLVLCPAALVLPALPREAWDIAFAPGEILTENGIYQTEKENA